MTRLNRALVIGASRGLGLGLAAELASRRTRVVATARDAAGAARIAELSRQTDGAVTAETVDIDDAQSVASLHRRLDGQVFDLLFVNAGIIGPSHQDAARVASEEIAALFLTNAIAPVRLAQLFLGRVAAGTGTIAFMTSGLGSVANNTGGGTALYRASKAALNSLTRSFTATLEGRGLTVLSVHPGWVRTDMGGAGAAIDIATSVRGVADVIAARHGSHRHVFVDYQGKEIPW